MDRADLADFLKRKRAGLVPADVGLHLTDRRRTPGLRREEVADLAHVSTDFYTRLEQHRGSRPSEQTTASLARALRLSPQERDHLYELAGHTPPPHSFRSDHPSPGLIRVLDSLSFPAQIISDLSVTLVQNPLAEALVGVQTRYTGLRRSMYYRWFTDPEERAKHPEEDHDAYSRIYAANLRLVYGTGADDPEASELVAALLRDSEAFRTLWERHEVGSRAGTLKRFLNPLVGLLTLDCQILTAESGTERLVVFTPMPGSEDAEKLALLSVVGAQSFAG